MQFTRVPDAGYVVHFLSLNTQRELDGPDVLMKYAQAVARASKIGGKKYHNRSYGGGVLFDASDLKELEQRIKEAVAQAEAKGE